MRFPVTERYETNREIVELALSYLKVDLNGAQTQLLLTAHRLEGCSIQFRTTSIGSSELNVSALSTCGDVSRDE
jgi:hypothetical protein